MNKAAGIIRNLEKRGYRFRVIKRGNRLHYEVFAPDLSEYRVNPVESAKLKELRALEKGACRYLTDRARRNIKKIRDKITHGGRN